MLKFSEDVHAVLAPTQVSVLLVRPRRLIPPPSAVTSVGVVTAPNSIKMSSTVTTVLFTVVVVPLTVKLPVTTVLLLIVVVPVTAPILTVVASPAKLTVVAVVLTSAKVVLPVVSEVVIAGLVPKTSAPEPVSSVTAAAKLDDEGVARNVATPVPRPEIPVVTGSPVALVNVPDVGVPRIGLTKVGVLAKTTAPVPVSSEIRAANWADVVCANCARVPAVVAIPVMAPLEPLTEITALPEVK